MVEEIDKLEPAKASKKKKMEKYKGDDLELKRKVIRKSFGIKKEIEDIIGKKKRY